MAIKIKLLDNGSQRYGLSASGNTLGRRYDNNAESIIVEFPKVEVDNNSSCVMIVTNGFIPVDTIPVQNGVPVYVSSNLSQYARIKIGFSFARLDGYIKNSDVSEFMFLNAQKPYDFVPSESSMKNTFDLLITNALVGVEQDGNDIMFKNVNGEIISTISIADFMQEQADLDEDDNTKASFVKGKDNWVSKDFLREELAKLPTGGDGSTIIVQGVKDIYVDGNLQEKDTEGNVRIELPQTPSTPTDNITITDVTNAIYENMGYEQQVDFNAILQDNDIIASLSEDIGEFEFKQNNSYLFHIYLPLTTLSGDLNDNYNIYLVDKNNNRIHLNCMYEKDITKTSNVGDFCQIQDYDTGIGYSWEFNGHYREINDGGTIRRVVYVDTITRETNPSMSGESLHNNITDSKLKVGTSVLCTQEYAINGHSYIAGHTYKVIGDWSSEELLLDVEDLTASTGSNVKMLTYDETTLGEHITEILGHINSENGGSLLSIGFKVGVNNIKATAQNIQFDRDGNVITTAEVTPFTQGDFVNCTLKHINDTKTGAYFNCGINQISNATLEIYKSGDISRVLLSNNQLTLNAGNGSPLLTFYNNVDISGMALEHLTIVYHA